MIGYIKVWLQLKADRRAVTALEYGLIAALIAVAIIGGASQLGNKLNTQFTNVSSHLNAQ